MFRTRFWVLVAATALTVGPLLTTAGYGLYLRSGLYASALARRASKFLRAPVQVGGVVPLDPASQVLRDVSVWLPGEFAPLFTCRTAVVRLAEGRNVELVLRDGRIEARLDEWSNGAIARLLATAFAHDFHRIRLRNIRLENMELVARHGRAALWAGGASGQVDFSGEAGRADLSCDGLNGVPAGEPVRIHCEFEPGEKPLVRELSLSVQRLGLEALVPCKEVRGQVTGDREQQTRRQADTETGSNGDGAVQAVLSGDREEYGRPFVVPPSGGSSLAVAEDTKARLKRVLRTDPRTNAANASDGRTTGAVPTCGWFTGRVVYRQKDRDSLAGTVELSGSLADVDLAALGSRAGRGGLSGTVNATLDRAVLDGRKVESIAGRARVEDLDVRGLLRLAGLPEAAGRAALQLHELRYGDGTVQALLAEAEVRDLEAAPLAQVLQAGTLTGRLNARLEKMRIVNGRLEALAGQVRMTPPDGRAGSIDRSLLEAAAQRVLHLSLPPILPDRIPYAALGARFSGEGDDLYIDGAAGPGEKFILVADLGSVPLPLVPAPPGPVGMQDLRAAAEAQVTRLARLLAEAKAWNLARR